MKYRGFKRLLDRSRQDLYRETIAENRKTIRVKKQETVVKNLEKIFDATLKISNKKGFQAMSMRDLSRETGLSMGALYSYFSSKEELLEMLQRYGRTASRRILEQSIALEGEPAARLRTALRTHLYLSEAMQPWFYFSYMEAKNLTGAERQRAVDSELYSEKIFAEILRQGQEGGIFRPSDYRLVASVIKAMLQDWYLKRSKYARRHVSVEGYADFLLDWVESFVFVTP